MDNHDDKATSKRTKSEEKAIASTGKNKRDDGSRREGLAHVRGKGEGDRAKSIAANDSDLSGGNLDRENFPDDRGETIGGIIGQLQELQQEHLAYVKAHEDRLKKRLEENHAHQKNVLDKMQALEENAALYLAQIQSQKKQNKK